MRRKFILTLVLVCCIMAAVACGSSLDANSGVNANNSGAVDESNKAENKSAEWEFCWTAPEEFIYDEEGGVYVTSDYPTDSSNITYTFQEDDGDGLNITAASYEEQEESEYAAFGSIDIIVNKFEVIENNGCEGLYVESQYSVDDTVFYQIQCSYQVGNGIHTVRYTAVGDTWLDTFKENVKTITLTPIYE